MDAPYWTAARFDTVRRSAGPFTNVGFSASATANCVAPKIADRINRATVHRSGETAIAVIA